MARPGQPTKYREEYCEKVIEFMGKGLSKEAFAGEIGVAKQTLYNWMETYPQFLDSVKEGEQKCLVFWEKTGVNGMAGRIPGFNATTWIFNMKNRFYTDWRDSHNLDHTSKGEKIGLETLLKDARE